MDHDLEKLDRPALIVEARRMRAAIREHRDASGHELCWHHPKLWALLPEQIEPAIAVPEWPHFIRGCVAYRQSLDHEAPGAERVEEEFEE